MEEEDEYQMVGVEKSLEITDLDVAVDTMVGVETSLKTTDLDQATVDHLSPTLLPGDLRS